MLRILVVIVAASLVGCAAMPPANTSGAPIKLEDGTVRTVQKALNDRGFDAGPVDGVFGKRTELALLNFEKSKGLPADGVLDTTAYAYLTQQSGSGASGGQSIGSTFSSLFGGGSAQASQGGSGNSAGSRSSTTGKGAALGAALGGAAGYLGGGNAKTAVIGAVIGALIGNFIEHQQVRSSQQVYEEYGTDSRVVLNDVRLSQDIIQPGEKGQATVSYDVVAPQPDKPRSITHTMDYYQGDTKLATNTQTMEVKPGGYETVFPLAVPEGAEEGEYKLAAQVQSADARDRKERSFQVIYARNELGGLQVVSVTSH